MKKYLTIFFAGLASGVFSQWNPNPAIDNAVCVQPYAQDNVKLISDLKGGAILVWEDYRNDPLMLKADIYAQRINAQGVVMWQTNGVPVCTDTSHQSAPTLVPDSLGGAYIVWQDKRTPKRNLFAQRIDSGGNIKWATNGVGVTLRNFDQKNPKLLNDGSNGMIILWQDSVGGAYDIYSQRMDITGNQLWAASGVGICTVIGSQVNPKGQINAATGEVFVVWQDKRNGTDYDIYVQKINMSGVSQWASGGVNITNIAGNQANPKISLDGNGGAIAAWQDKRNGLDYDIYAQRVNNSGAAQWVANGVPISIVGGNQNSVDLTTTNIVNGAILAWKDGRMGTLNTDIYSQKINLSGAVQWAANGIPVSNANFNQSGPNVSHDGAGGVIISFQDSSGGTWDIKAQRVDAAGNLLWAAGGAPVGIASGDQINQSSFTNQDGSSIYAFQDMRSGNDDIYAYKLEINGNPVGINSFSKNSEGVSVFPNPSSGKITFHLIPNEKNYLRVTDVGGKEILSREILNDDRFEWSEKLEAGIYFYSARSGNSLATGKFVIIN